MSLRSGPPAAGARTAAPERSIPASSSLLLRACACVRVLPQPDSSAEAAFSQERKKNQKAALSQFGAALGVFGASGEESR